MTGSGRRWGVGRGAGWRRACAGVVVLLWAMALVGCRYELDGLYALPLERSPVEEDWQRLPPYRVEVVGGRTSAPSDADVDDDAVHLTTASCHHGTDVPPVVVELRAFWSEDRLYLRADWTDPTENRGPVWTWTADGWRAGDQWEDGLGVLWGRQGETFQCARYCHLVDWRMAGESARAEFAMRTPDGDPGIDFWVWRAGRGTVDGMVEDSVLGPEGRRGDGGGSGDTYLPNSMRHRSGAAEWFGPDDAPQVHPPPGSDARAPGYLRVDVPDGRSEVETWSHWDGGRWTVVLSRPLVPLDGDDVEFLAGNEGVSFGLAILDAVDRDHLAAAEPVRLRLIGPEELARAGEGAKKWWEVAETRGNP